MMQGKARVNEIDLLRFVAALSVVLFHYTFRGYAADSLSEMPYPALAPVAKYGYLGVELFFLISGFVILMTASSGTLKDFTISRAVRLYPAFWQCCTITFLVTVLAAPAGMSVTLPQYLANMTMLSGFAGVPSVDGVYWSLFVELQFYALIAVVLTIGRIHQAQWFFLLWLVATLAMEAFPAPGKLRFVLIADYAAYFIAGAIAYLIWARGMSILRVAAFVAAWGLALCQSLESLPAIEEHYRTPMSGTVVAMTITSIFAVMFLVAARKTGALGRRRWLVLGALTYPLYLLHQNIGYILFNTGYPVVNPHVLLWGTLLLMLTAAFAVNRLVERRFAPHMKRCMEQAFDWLARGLTAWRERLWRPKDHNPPTATESPGEGLVTEPRKE
jgi:peptidoglycan/LPS O-acetylase OafA/YrhL